MPLLRALILVVLFAGCGLRQTPFNVRFADPDDRRESVSLEVTISRDGQVISSGAFPLGSPTPFPRLSPGAYLIEVQAIGERCVIVARGSNQLTLPRSDGEVLEVLLTSGDGQVCTTPTCLSLAECGGRPVDAGVDQGSDARISCNSSPSCDDGNVCNGIETCVSTFCQAGTPLNCPSDGNACNGTEICSPATGCTVSNVPSCDDGLTCTADSCNPSSGSCSNVMTSPCGAPSNDLPAGAVLIPSSDSGTLSGTLVGATSQSADCGTQEVFYRWNVTRPTIGLLSTIGSGEVPTTIAYRGTDCGVAECAGRSCETVHAALARYLPVGNHCFSVAAATDRADSFTLSFAQLPAASGQNTLVSGNGRYGGTLATTPGFLDPMCAGDATATGDEDAFFFFTCPGRPRMITAATCMDSGELSPVWSIRRPSSLQVICGYNTPICGQGGTASFGSPFNELTLGAFYADTKEGGSGSYTLTFDGF